MPVKNADVVSRYACVGLCVCVYVCVCGEIFCFEDCKSWAETMETMKGDRREGELLRGAMVLGFAWQKLKGEETKTETFKKMLRLGCLCFIKGWACSYL